MNHINDFSQVRHYPAPPSAGQDNYHAWRASWYRKLNAFRNMPPDTNRPNTIRDLFSEGMWLELARAMEANESRELVIKAATTNGYLAAHGYTEVVTAGDSNRAWARGRYVQRYRNGGRAGVSKPDTSLVPPSCTRSRVTRLADDTYLSPLPASAKRQIYVAGIIQIQHPDWTNLVMAARPTGQAAMVGKKYVGGNWRKAEKLGLIGYNPGVDYETAKELGVDSKSSEITLNLDIYSDEPVDHPLVNLDDYADRVAEFRGYIKYRQRALKDERQAYLRAEDTSTATTPQEPVQRASAESIALLKALLNGES